VLAWVWKKPSGNNCQGFVDRRKKICDVSLVQLSSILSNSCYIPTFYAPTVFIGSARISAMSTKKWQLLPDSYVQIGGM